jgi:hypothetical protein
MVHYNTLAGLLYMKRVIETCSTADSGARHDSNSRSPSRVGHDDSSGSRAEAGYMRVTPKVVEPRQLLGVM